MNEFDNQAVTGYNPLTGEALHGVQGEPVVVMFDPEHNTFMFDGDTEARTAVFHPMTGQNLQAPQMEQNVTAEQQNIVQEQNMVAGQQETVPEQNQQVDNTMNNQGQQFVGYDPYTGQPVYQNVGYQQNEYNQNAGYQQNEYNQNAGYQQNGYNQNTGYQQNGYNPNMGYQQNGAVPAAPKKKGGAKVLIGVGAAVAVVAVGAVGVFAASSVLGKGNVKPEDAFVNTFENAKNESSYNNIFGVSDMFKECKDKGFETETSITVDQVDGEKVPGSLTINLATKADNKNSAFDIVGSGKMSGISVDDCEFYMDRDQALVNIPILYDKAFSIDYSGDFAQKLEDSDLISYSGMTDSDIEEIALVVKAFQELADASAKGDVSNTDELKQVRKDFFANVEMEKTDAKKVTIDGKEKKCKGYTLTITEDDVVGVIEALQDIAENNNSLFSEDLMEQFAEYGIDLSSDTSSYDEMITAIEGMDDIEANVYIYKGQVAAIDTESDDFTFSYVTEGGNNYLENMECKMKVDGEKITFTRETTDDKAAYDTKYTVSADGEKITFSSSYDKKSQEFKVEFNAGDEGGMTCKGTITDLQKGKSVSMDIDKLELTEYGSSILKCSGTFSFGALTSSVEKPDVDSVDILEMSSGDLFEILGDIESNASFLY